MNHVFETVIPEVARLAGIAFETFDAFGRHNPVNAETQFALLNGLGLSVTNPSEAADTRDRLRRLRGAILPRLVTVTAGGQTTIALNGALGAAAVVWTLVNDETGQSLEGRAELTGRNEIRLPVPDAGYFRLHVQAGAARASATLIAAPPTCYVPPALAGGARLWGLAAQLVSLRSSGDFGVGDFGSVREAVRLAAPFGASFLGLSPLHALFAADRSKFGPYGPSSRLMLDPIHIDVSAMAEAQGIAARQDLRLRSLADHEAVWQAKLPILERAFAAERGHSGDVRPDIAAHATFEALSESFARQGIPSAAAWPAAYRDPASPEVARFRVEHADRVAFHAWLQQLADRQIGEAATEAKRAGMGVGLYADLAVGADAGGSEVWSAADRYAASLSIGAPADPLAPQGQDWGIAPLNPIALEEQGLAGFRALIAANMCHAGALRIDHAFQLQRLYLVPKGEAKLLGAYVAYPFEALLASLRIESHRARCMVIGEDLGTAPPGFSDTMMAAGVLSYRVLFFERGDHGSFKPPALYPETAIAVFATHDLPTVRGWWTGHDIEVRTGLGLWTGEEAEAARRQRQDDKLRLMEALLLEGLTDEGVPPDEPPIEPIVRYLARARARLAALQLEDVLGEIDQANLPGTVEGHPNWRRRLSMELGAIAAPNGPLAPLAAAMRREGRGEARDHR